MLKETIPIKKLQKNAVIPTYGTEYSAGADIYAYLEEPITISPGETEQIWGENNLCDSLFTRNCLRIFRVIV